MKETKEYYILASKRKPKLWKPNKNDHYDYIYDSKEEAESCLDERDKKYWQGIKVKQTLET